MSVDTVHIYYKGESPNVFLNHVSNLFKSLGISVEFRKDNKQAWRQSIDEDAYSVFQDRGAFHRKAVQAISVLDDTYWVLEQAALPKEMDIANKQFDPDAIKEGSSERFFEEVKQKNIKPYEHEYAIEDFVLVVLDDHLGKEEGLRPYSSFQMIKQVLKREPEREVILWQDPNYPLSDNAHVRLMEFDHEPQVSISSAQIDRLLAACSFVVSQNSLVSIQAMLHQKFSLTFGDFPFHHICRNPERDERVQKSFNRMHRDQPVFERYLYWLLKEQAISTDDKDIEQRLTSRFQEIGW